jgi:phage shock protein C
MEKTLYRNEMNKVLAGVASGLAEYFEMDVTWVRIIFVFAAVFGFSGVFIYLILWIVIPNRPFNPAGFPPYNTDYRVYEDQPFTSYTAGSPQSETPVPPYLKNKQSNGNTRLIGGLILVFLGSYFLLDEFNFFPNWFDFHKMWPIIFIIPGILLILKAGKTRYSTDRNRPHVSDEGTSDTMDSTRPDIN